MFSDDPPPNALVVDPRAAYNARRRAADPLAIEDSGPDALEAQEEGEVQPRRARARNQIDANVPPVKDVTGEKVMDSFEHFLRE